MSNGLKRYKYIWKWVNSAEDYDYLDNWNEVLEEVFWTGICIDDLEYLKLITQRWNKTKKCWCSRKSEHMTIYQKSKEDIDRWYLKNEKK